MKRQPKIKYQPNREEMKAALRHIDKLVDMICMEACFEVDSNIRLSVGKSEDFARLMRERMDRRFDE